MHDTKYLVINKKYNSYRVSVTRKGKRYMSKTFKSIEDAKAHRDEILLDMDKPDCLQGTRTARIALTRIVKQQKSLNEQVKILAANLVEIEKRLNME